MFYSGIADEAAPSLQKQIDAHQELGWNHIELRLVDGTGLTDLSDDDFDRVAGAVEEADMQVSCFAAQLANWARPIDIDFETDVAEMKRAVPRMQRLSTPFIRCMSYPNAKQPLADADWRREAVRRMKELAKLAADGGVTLVHENCHGWGSQGPQQTLDMLADVGSENLKLVFDTGNPIPCDQDAWEYYDGVRDHVVYVHIKDYKPDGDNKENAVFPGEGSGYVREIITDLFANGYDGGFSIEPHITSVIHRGEEAVDPELAYSTYVEYGRKLEALVKEIRA